MCKEDITKRQNSLLLRVSCSRTHQTVFSVYLLIQSSTRKKCIEHCLTALATLLHVINLLLTLKRIKFKTSILSGLPSI